MMAIKPKLSLAPLYSPYKEKNQNLEKKKFCNTLQYLTLSELLETMDKEIPAPERNIDKPFLMAIEGTYHIAVKESKTFVLG
jgi:translation elongation factor EF-Tu-like GTPase